MTECLWRCQQNGELCDPGKSNKCDCVAHNCVSEVSYVEAGSGSEESSLLLIPIVAGAVLAMCCCAGIFFLRDALKKKDSDHEQARNVGGNSAWLVKEAEKQQQKP